MNWWMITGPYKEGVIPQIKKILELLDIARWVYCVEKGTTEYLHVHLKIKCSENISEARLRKLFFPYHVEKSNESDGYLRKKGYISYESSEDTNEVREVRTGTLYPWQEALVNRVLAQSVRQVTVLYDPDGGIGKTWLSAYLFEKGLALCVPPTLDTVKEMIQYICSLYKNEDIIILDIPRSLKWSVKLSTAIETIKDGLLYDSRYTGKVKHIRGIKVLVFTNHDPPRKMLSEDRWDVVEVEDGCLVIQ